VEPVAWIVADVATWSRSGHALWHDRAVLHFLTEAADRDGYRRALGAGTAPGSVAILSAFAPDGPTMCSGLPVRRYGQAEFEAFLGPASRRSRASRCCTGRPAAPSSASAPMSPGAGVS
jgi:hypothetical protein